MHSILVLYGIARSGKSTFRDILAWLLGQNFRSATARNLTDQFGLEPFVGASGACFNETSVFNVPQANMLKALSGGDPVSAQMKFKGAYTGALNLSLILISNEIPQLPDASGAIMSRLDCYVFRNSISEEARDVNLKAKLKAELPGISRLFRQAYLRWIAGGCKLSKNPEAQQLREHIQEHGNPTKYFVEQHCQLRGAVGRNALYQHYLKNSEGEPLSQRSFSDSLLSSFSAIRASENKLLVGGKRERTWEGICLK